MKLTDTQLIILADAAKRDDGAIVLPDRLKGGAAQKVVEKLVGAGLIEEVQTNGTIPAWRQDEETGAMGLRITEAGLAAIGAEEPDGAEQTALAGKTAKPKARSTPKASSKNKRHRDQTSNSKRQSVEPRTGTKRAIVIGMLQRARGATMDEIVGATGWLPHTTRASLTGFRKAGITVERSREKRGRSEVSTYRIVGGPVALTSTKSARAARGK